MLNKIDLIIIKYFTFITPIIEEHASVSVTCTQFLKKKHTKIHVRY
jgi:hypothetical protein